MYKQTAQSNDHIASQEKLPLLRLLPSDLVTFIKRNSKYFCNRTMNLLSSSLLIYDQKCHWKFIGPAYLLSGTTEQILSSINSSFRILQIIVTWFDARSNTLRRLTESSREHKSTRYNGECIYIKATPCMNHIQSFGGTSCIGLNSFDQ